MGPRTGATAANGPDPLLPAETPTASSSLVPPAAAAAAESALALLGLVCDAAAVRSRRVVASVEKAVREGGWRSAGEGRRPGSAWMRVLLPEPRAPNT
eukprot:204679-Pelagomonas_calceolata.AAC.3